MKNKKPLSDEEILKEALKTKLKDEITKEEMEQIETLEDLPYWSGIAGIRKALSLKNQQFEKAVEELKNFINNYGVNALTFEDIDKIIGEFQSHSSQRNGSKTNDKSVMSGSKSSGSGSQNQKGEEE